MQRMQAQILFARCVFIAALCQLGVFTSLALAQSGFDDDRVMLQGFYWESYRHGDPDSSPRTAHKKWYDIVKPRSRRSATHAST